MAEAPSQRQLAGLDPGAATGAAVDSDNEEEGEEKEEEEKGARRYCSAPAALPAPGEALTPQTRHMSGGTPAVEHTAAVDSEALDAELEGAELAAPPAYDFEATIVDTLAEIRTMAAEGQLDADEAQEMTRGVMEEARLEHNPRPALCGAHS